jgi:hypothetical protein
MYSYRRYVTSFREEPAMYPYRRYVTSFREEPAMRSEWL